MPNTTPHTPHNRPVYIEGIGWHRPTEHRMTRWPRWKETRWSGTYMVTINVEGGQRLLGTLKGSTNAVYEWMKTHPAQVQSASADPLYYRHTLLEARPMPFVKSPCKSPCNGVSTPLSTSAPPRTHIPIEALHHPEAPHIALSPLGEAVKAAWEHMPQIEPLIEQVCIAIMPNHIHAIIAVHHDLTRPIGTVIRSFMGTTTHTLHKMIADGSVQWHHSCDGVSTPSKPSLWTPGYCIGICTTEEKLHTRIGYVLENPFFGIMEKEHPHFMKRTMLLTIAGRQYCAYGNMFLLKEPDRMQVFCHRLHPTTRRPYHLTKDFQEDKQTALDAATDGVVMVTPGISPGEAEIMWAVLRAGGNVINIQKEIPLNNKWHPEKEKRLYCQRGQLLVLAAHDVPEQEYRNHQGDIIPSATKYAQFHSLNAIAEDLCKAGIEHECKVKAAP